MELEFRSGFPRLYCKSNFLRLGATRTGQSDIAAVREKRIVASAAHTRKENGIGIPIWIPTVVLQIQLSAAGCYPHGAIRHSRGPREENRGKRGAYKEGEWNWNSDLDSHGCIANPTFCGWVLPARGNQT